MLSNVAVTSHFILLFCLIHVTLYHSMCYSLYLLYNEFVCTETANMEVGAKPPLICASENYLSANHHLGDTVNVQSANKKSLSTLSVGGLVTFFTGLLVMMCNPSPLKSRYIVFVVLALSYFPLAMLALPKPLVLDSEHI